MKCSGFLFLIPEMKYTKKGQSAVLIPLLKRSRKKRIYPVPADGKIYAQSLSVFI